MSLRSIFKQHFHRKSHKVAEACAIDREVFAAINEGVLAVAEKSEVVHCTPRLIEMLGVDLTAQPGPPLRDRIAAVMDDRQAFTRFWDEQTRSPQSSASCEFTLAQRRRFVSVHSRPVRDADAGFVARLWVFEDITDRKELEASLMQSQKMEAIGRLAGGVAHDFNNMLMAISGNLELTKMAESRQVSEVIDLIEAAELATDRAAKLVRNLLGFSRQAKLELQVVNANLAIERLIDLLKHTLDPTIEIRKSLQADLWPAKLDETQFQQVLLNICLNARDAIANNRGWISVTTENHPTPDGDFICISISDNGGGMSEDVRRKIFEPFFTTKPPGHGTGLGLAMSYAIVQQHKGRLGCISHKGSGTQFDIFLPRCESASKSDLGGFRDEAGNERNVEASILLGEDSDLVRDSIAAILRSAGYRVTAVNDGRQVLEAFEHDPHFDLAIIDLTLPVLSGRETFKALRSLNHELPIIMCSGYAFDVNQFIAATGEAPASFIQKPFRKSRLLSVVQGALESISPAAE